MTVFCKTCSHSVDDHSEIRNKDGTLHEGFCTGIDSKNSHHVVGDPKTKTMTLDITCTCTEFVPV